MTAENRVLLTAEIVGAYVANNAVQASNLATLIADVHAAVAGLDKAPEPAVAVQVPAVNPKKSVHADYIICLEDGKRYKTLKRHIATDFGLTPDQYRMKWSLPADYPMVAPNYAATRSALAISLGLGRKAKPGKAAAKPKRARRLSSR